jgi:hypothetical protein
VFFLPCLSLERGQEERNFKGSGIGIDRSAQLCDQPRGTVLDSVSALSAFQSKKADQVRVSHLAGHQSLEQSATAVIARFQFPPRRAKSVIFSGSVCFSFTKMDNECHKAP